MALEDATTPVTLYVFGAGGKGSKEDLLRTIERRLHAGNEHGLNRFGSLALDAER